MGYYFSHTDQQEIRNLLIGVDENIVIAVIDLVEGVAYDSFYNGEESGADDAYENCEWVDDMIASGDFDDNVHMRAEKLGYIKPIAKEENTRQQRHRDAHPDGTWGWEYCYKCVEYWGDN